MHPPFKNEHFLEITLKPYPVETMVELAPGKKLVPGVVVEPHDAEAEVAVKADTDAVGGEEADMDTSLGEGSAEAGSSIYITKIIFKLSESWPLSAKLNSTKTLRHFTLSTV